MSQFVLSVAGSLVSAGALALAIRYLLTRAVDNALARGQLRLDAHLKEALAQQQAQLDLRRTQEGDRFRRLMDTDADSIAALVRAASQFRRAVLAIPQPVSSGELDALYHDYCAVFYRNPILPEPLFRAAHQLRQLMEVLMGAHTAMNSGETLAPTLTKQLDTAYAQLRDQAGEVLLPSI